MDLLQQFADRLDSAFDAAGVGAIEDNAGPLTELAASPVIRAAVATELAILKRDGNTSAAQWNGAELVLAARSRWLLAVSFYRSRIESTVTSVPNVGLVSLLSGEADMTLFDLPPRFNPDRFDPQAHLGAAWSSPLADTPLLVDGRRTCFYTPQSFVIASVGSILLRGNLWCPTGPRRGVRSPRDAIFSYYMAHDHNYHFLTVGQFGPGYLTEIYETDPLAHDGRPGTTIDITLLEETALPTGKVMAYRAHRDIHVQLPPDSLSVSLNLMVRDMRSDTREQYAFDIGECRSRAVITGYPDASPVSVQASLVELAGHLPDAGIHGLLHDLCEADHVAPRVRRHAVESLRASAWPDEDGLLRLARRIPDSRQWEARLLD